ncbi:hypothetical protein TNCT_208831, partial [Trichonephila clavata]
FTNDRFQKYYFLHMNQWVSLKAVCVSLRRVDERREWLRKFLTYLKVHLSYDGLDHNIHFNLAQVTCFATVSQSKCEVQMNNYYLSSPEKVFHSNWNYLSCLLWK